MQPADIEDLRLTAGHGCEAEELGIDAVREPVAEFERKLHCIKI
jgi:hypothetical protein